MLKREVDLKNSPVNQESWLKGCKVRRLCPNLSSSMNLAGAMTEWPFQKWSCLETTIGSTLEMEPDTKEVGYHRESDQYWKWAHTINGMYSRLFLLLYWSVQAHSPCHFSNIVNTIISHTCVCIWITLFWLHWRVPYRVGELIETIEWSMTLSSAESNAADSTPWTG